jgi:hypothetical protein
MKISITSSHDLNAGRPVPMTATDVRIFDALDQANWALIAEDQARLEWNSWLQRLEDFSPLQSFEWGQYQKSLGWQPNYWIDRGRDGRPRAMCVALLRRLPGSAGLIWCTGGPIGDVDLWTALPDAIRQTQQLRHLYFRFRCDRPRNEADASRLRRKDWSPPTFAMGPNLSMEIDLTAAPDVLLAGFAKNWRRNLRQAQRNGLIVEAGHAPDLADVRRVFGEMEDKKRISQLFSDETLQRLLDSTGEDIVCLCCYNQQRRLLAIRVTLLTGNKAYDYLAATSAEGRTFRASYLLFWESLGICRSRGVTRFDLGGIDPSGNPGVYRFKKDTGAAEVHSLGEWHWASSAGFRWLGDSVVRHKGWLRGLARRLG